MKKNSKITKTIPTKPKNPVTQNKPSNSSLVFNPYNKQFSQQLDSLIQCMRQPLWSTTEYQCSQIVDKISIAYKLYKGSSHKLKYLKILSGLYKRYRDSLGQQLHILIDCLIQYPDDMEEKLYLQIISRYFATCNNSANHIDLNKLKAKLIAKPNNIILWKILQHLTQKITIVQHNQKVPQLAQIIIKAITNSKRQEEIPIDKFLVFFSKFLECDVKEFYKCVNLFELSLRCWQCQVKKYFLTELLGIIQVSINLDQKYLFYSATFLDYFYVDSSLGFKTKPPIQHKYTDKQKYLVISQLENFIKNILGHTLTNEPNDEIKLLSHIQRIFYLFGFLHKIKSNFKWLDDNKQKISQEEVQDTIFNVLFSVEKNFTNYQLIDYQELYLAFPHYFQLRHFQACLEIYPKANCTRFVKNLIQKWIQVPLRPFQLKQIIFTFINFCFSLSNSQNLTNLIHTLKQQTLISLSILIYKQSFDDKTQKKIKIPRTLSSLQNFAELLSAGYSQKTAYIDRYFASGLQNMQWMAFLEDIVSEKQYYLIRFYFFILNFYFIQNKHLINDYVSLIFSTFQKSICKMTLQSCCGLTHILSILLFQQISPKQGEILTALFCKNFKQIYSLYEQSYNSRTSCMKYMNLTAEDVANNLKALQKAKKMHKMMLKNWLKLIDKLGQDIYRYIPNGVSYQDISQQLLRYGKYSQSCPYSTIRRLSCKASSKSFFNQVSSKLNEKLMSYQNFLMYRQMIFAVSETFTEQQFYQLTSTINCEKILQICIKALQQEIQISNQRQLLKCKLIASQILKEMKVLCQNRLARKFLSSYKSKLKEIGQAALKILYRDKKLIGKYQRDLILHIRCFILNWILEDHHSDFQLVSIQSLNRILSLLIIDECYEIRLFIINSLWSKYKLTFEQFRTNTHYNLILITLAASFQPNPRIKLLAQKVIISIPFCPQFLNILSLTAANVALMLSNFIPIDSFIREFIDLWFRNKQAEYLLYVLMQFLLDSKEILGTQKKTDFNLDSVMTYYISRTMQQKQILENCQMTHSQVIYSLFLEGIKTKPRANRILKSKKDVEIDLNTLRKIKLLL